MSAPMPFAPFPRAAAILIVTASLCLGPGMAAADEDLRVASARDAVSTFWLQLSGALTEEVEGDGGDAPPGTIIARLDTMMAEVMDLDAIGRFVLGRRWIMLTPDQKDRFAGVMRATILSVFARQLSAFEGQTLDVRAVRVLDADEAIVETAILIGGRGPGLSADWHLSQAGDAPPRIRDVILLGHSLRTVQRDRWSVLLGLSGGDFDRLFDRMCTRLDPVVARALEDLEC